MQNLNYNSYYKKGAVKSPYQSKPFYAQGVDTQEEGTPIREAIQKNSRDLVFQAKIREDVETVKALQVPGLIAFICHLYKDGKVIAIGRGSAVLGSGNRYAHKVLSSAANGSVVDAVCRGSRYLEALSQDTALEEKFPATSTIPRKEKEPEYVRAISRSAENEDAATDKQKAFLSRLYSIKLDSSERELRLSQLGELTRREASEQIQAFQ